MTTSDRSNKAAIELPHKLTVGKLASLYGLTLVETIKELMRFGKMLTVNEEVGLTDALKVAKAFNIRVKKPPEKERSDAVQSALETTDSQKLKPRPPVITITGHVDHGKTTLLDTIQGTKLTKREAGGITQSIGAYPIEHNKKTITIIDTPGHAAFTAMRASGVRVTDVNILVVAADDGVMPQTIEAIDHAKAAKVPIVVAINKTDLEKADPEQVKFQLAEHGITVEELGGDTVVAKISALTGEGVDDLLESVLLVAEIAELKADFDRPALGVVLESRLDRKKGVLVTVIIRNGTLKVGDAFVVGNIRGKVRAITDGLNKPLKQAKPGDAVQLLGVPKQPQLGAKFEAVENEQAAKQLLEMRHDLGDEYNGTASQTTLEDFKRDRRTSKPSTHVVELVVKAATQGELKAVERALAGIEIENAAISIVHAGTGMVNESDVLLASTAGKQIIAFNSQVNRNTLDQAQRLGVRITNKGIIYELLDDIAEVVAEILRPKDESPFAGEAKVQTVFDHGKSHKIAGVIVNEGIVQKDLPIVVFRDDEQIFKGAIKSMRHLSQRVNEIKESKEGGIVISKFDDFKPGDILRCERRRGR